MLRLIAAAIAARMAAGSKPPRWAVSWAVDACALDVGEADGTPHAGAGRPDEAYAKFGRAAAGPPG